MIGRRAAKKTVIDGFTFDSKAEARYYELLKLREMAGEVCKISVHPTFPLLDGFIRAKVGKAKEERFQGITYTPDFTFTLTEPIIHDCRAYDRVAVDVKGHREAVYKLKKKYFFAIYNQYVFIEATPVGAHFTEDMWVGSIIYDVGG